MNTKLNKKKQEKVYNGLLQRLWAKTDEFLRKEISYEDAQNNLLREADFMGKLKDKGNLDKEHFNLCVGALLAAEDDLSSMNSNFLIKKFLEEEDTQKLIEMVKKEKGLESVMTTDDNGNILFIKDVAEYFALWLQPNEKGIEFVEELNKQLNKFNRD